MTTRRWALVLEQVQGSGWAEVGVQTHVCTRGAMNAAGIALPGMTRWMMTWGHGPEAYSVKIWQCCWL